MDKATLTLKHIYKNFYQDNKPVTVLDNIDITFAQPHTYAITGLSGVGKSTLMHIIAGLDIASNGLVLFNNYSLHNLSKNSLSKHLNKSVGLLFQTPHLVKELTIQENIMLPGMIGNTPTTVLEKRTTALLEKVGLADKFFCKPGELSGGQQQRVALARALINQPQFLIADEPTGNLDAQTGKAIIQLMLDCTKEWGMGIIVSSHDAYVAQAMDEIYELVNGRLIKK